ncbi:hypothetical protein KUCAC02_030544 [Chaenocephalus aceratus]|uniref:Uncharacterized protein n=1 Tax=Chaenocephalus aceratus TaxID=36190 RepID=A0ACB9XJ63_CHAAC|nr:hypothetical protein KUCAC02_030544 [Chaenocephalus aceratus]
MYCNLAACYTVIKGGTVGTVLSLPVPAGLSQSSSDKILSSANQSSRPRLHMVGGPDADSLSPTAAPMERDAEIQPPADWTGLFGQLVPILLSHEARRPPGPRGRPRSPRAHRGLSANTLGS